MAGKSNTMVNSAWKLTLLFALFIVLAAVPTAGAKAIGSHPINPFGVKVSLNSDTGAASLSVVRAGNKLWSTGQIALRLKDESRQGKPVVSKPKLAGKNTLRSFPGLPVDSTETWTHFEGGVSCEFRFNSKSIRTGYEATLDIPALSRSRLVFTPGERGVMRVSAYPTFKPCAYGSIGWGTGSAWTLPLVSIFDLASHSALAIALPPDSNIPSLRFEWQNARTLRIILSHRGIGGSRPSPLKLLFFAHRDDYRSVLAAYISLYPRWFKPGLPRGEYEGAFWYHHIQSSPDPKEMARQDVRFIWASFWFVFLGNYMPEATEWHPFTYARMWSLHETMTDEKIRKFVAEMAARRIGVFAYFNVAEYGGYGGELGGSEEAQSNLKRRFADAMVKDEKGQPIPTWEGAFAMNAGRQYSFFTYLQEQIHRHFVRIPGLAGFCIDRLDWASIFDYGHSDGLSMIGARPVENMAIPVSVGVAEVVGQSHAVGKRVYVNQFYRIEPLKDVDGYCHENDYLRGLAYLSPYRPVSAWHMRKSYKGDLLAFEAHMKTRLEFAVFPQMISHEFPISQQAPDPAAADMLEVYAPLFAPLHGKRQVLVPGCASVTGPNDVNLFVNGNGCYVAPITSRVQFLTRGSCSIEKVRLTLHDADVGKLKWAHVYSADGDPYRASIQQTKDGAAVTLNRHISASIVVMGSGKEPPLITPLVASSAAARERRFHPMAKSKALPANLAIPAHCKLTLRLKLAPVGEAEGKATVYFDGVRLGEAGGGLTVLPVTHICSHAKLSIVLETGDEGIWLAPERCELLAIERDGSVLRCAEWTFASSTKLAGAPYKTGISLSPITPTKVIRSSVRFLYNAPGVDSSGPLVGFTPTQTTNKGDICSIAVGQGATCIWADKTDDHRVLPDNKGNRIAACWFAEDELRFDITPTDMEPYEIAVYLLDYDRNGRAEEVELSDDGGRLDLRSVDKARMAEGAWLHWRATGPVSMSVRKKAGFNTVLSGIYISR